MDYSRHFNISQRNGAHGARKMLFTAILSVLLLLLVFTLLSFGGTGYSALAEAEVVTFSVNNKTYNGKADTLDAILVSTPTISRDTYYSVLFVAQDGTEYDNVAPVIAGTYSVQITSKRPTEKNCNATLSYVISPKTLTVQDVALAVTDKVYDGNAKGVATGYSVNSADIMKRDGVTDEVGITAEVTFADKNAGESKPAVVTYRLTGAAQTNYVLSKSQATSVGNISPLPVSVADLESKLAVHSSKTYDGSAVFGPFAFEPSIKILGELDTVDVYFTTPNKAVGNQRTNSVYYALSEELSSSGNYTLGTYDGEMFLATINTKTLSIALTDLQIEADKIYDGTNRVDVTLLHPENFLAAGDSVTLEPVGVFVDAGGSPVTAAGAGTVRINITLTLKGADSANYVSGTLATVGTISKRKIVLQENSVKIREQKYWDGTNVGEILSSGIITNKCGEDIVGVDVSAIFSGGTEIGGGKTITVSFTVTGNANYSAPDGYVIENASIIARPLTVVMPDDKISKVYDGNALVPSGLKLDFSGVIDLMPKVELVINAVYEDANAGIDKNIQLSFSLSGDDKAFYSVPESSVILGNILPKQLTVSTTPILGTTTKEYDGNVTLSGTPTIGELEGVIGTDVVTLSAEVRFKNSTVGYGNKLIDVVYSLSGASAANYLAPETDSISGGTISARAVRLTLTNEHYYGAVGDIIKGYSNVEVGMPTPSFSISFVVDGIITATVPTSVGTYVAYVRVLDSIYTLVDEGNNPVSVLITQLIIKQSPSSVVLAPYSAVYNGAAVTSEQLRAFCSGISPVDAEVAFRFYNSLGAPLSETPINAGTYQYEAYVNGTDDYSGSVSAKQSFTISKQLATVNAINLTQQLSTENPIKVFIYPEFLMEDSYYTVHYKAKNAADDAYAVQAPSQIGEFVAKVTVDHPNYRCASGGNDFVTFNMTVLASFLSVSITPAQPDVVSGNMIAGFNAVYSGSPFTFNSDYDGVADYRITKRYYDVLANLALTGAPVNSGIYRVSISVEGATETGVSEAYFTIEKKDVTDAEAFYVDSNVSPAYDGVRKNVAVVGNRGLSYSVEYSLGGVKVQYPINAGSYDVTVTIDDVNYSGTASGTFVIQKSNYILSLKEGITLQYSNTAFNTSLITQISDGGTVLTEYSSNIAINYVYVFDATSEIVSTPGAIGSYTVTARFASSDNFVNSEETAPITLNITKADINLTLKRLTTLDGEENVLVAGYVSGQRFTLGINDYSIKNYSGNELYLQPIITFKKDGSEDITDIATDVGKYTMYILLEGTEYYNEYSSSVTLYIRANEIKLGSGIEISGGDSFFWDGTAKQLTFVTNPTGVNYYTNYYVMDGSEKREVLPADLIMPNVYYCTVTIDDPNYSGLVECTMTIKKLPVTINVMYTEHVYGSSTDALAKAYYSNMEINLLFTYEYYRNTTNNPQTVALGEKLSARPIGAGFYAVVATVTDTKYEGTVTLNYTIAKKQLVVSITPVQKVYDGLPAETDVTYEGFEYDDSVRDITAPTMPTESKNAGTTTVSMSGGSSNNYYFVYESAEITITKKDLTIGIVLNPNGYLQGSSVSFNSASNFTFDGLVKSDTVQSALQSWPSLSYKIGDTFENKNISQLTAGEYEVSLYGARSDNYDITYLKGAIILIFNNNIANEYVEISGARFERNSVLSFGILGVNMEKYSEAKKTASAELRRKNVYSIYDVSVSLNGNVIDQKGEFTVEFKEIPDGIDFTSEDLSMYFVSGGVASRANAYQMPNGNWAVRTGGVNGQIIFAYKKSYTWVFFVIGSIIVAAGICFAILKIRKSYKELPQAVEDVGVLIEATPQAEDEGGSELEMDMEDAITLYNEEAPPAPVKAEPIVEEIPPAKRKKQSVSDIMLSMAEQMYGPKDDSVQEEKEADTAQSADASSEETNGTSTQEEAVTANAEKQPAKAKETEEKPSPVPAKPETKGKKSGGKEEAVAPEEATVTPAPEAPISTEEETPATAPAEEDYNLDDFNFD